MSLLNKQANELTCKLKAQEQAYTANLAHQLEIQAEEHATRVACVCDEQARTQSRSEQLLTVLQAAQQSCQTSLKQAADSHAEIATLRAEVGELRSSLQDRDDLILDLDTQIKVGCWLRQIV